MTKARNIDHVRHGWALLSMRIPGIRDLQGSAQHVAETCECYSLAILQIEKLRRDRASDAAIADYEQLRQGLEVAVHDYLMRFRRLAG